MRVHYIWTEMVLWCEQGIVSSKDQEIIFFKTQVRVLAEHCA